MFVIPATQEAEVEGFRSMASQAKAQEKLYLKNKLKQKRLKW
jgi:hypothetical protein